MYYDLNLDLSRVGTKSNHPARDPIVIIIRFSDVTRQMMNDFSPKIVGVNFSHEAFGTRLGASKSQIITFHSTPMKAVYVHS